MRHYGLASYLLDFVEHSITTLDVTNYYLFKGALVSS